MFKMNLILENWRNFVNEVQTEKSKEELDKISGELKSAVKMHQSQADRIDKITKDSGEKEIEEAKNKEGKEQGADGKACWAGKRYAGTEDGKDKCVPMQEKKGLWDNIHAKRK